MVVHDASQCALQKTAGISVASAAGFMDNRACAKK
jgi:hypothetical protein